MSNPAESRGDASMLGYVHTTTRASSSPHSRDSNSLSTFSDLSDPPSFSNSFSQDEDHVDHDVPTCTPLSSPISPNGSKIGAMGNNNNNRPKMNAKLSSVRKSMSSFVTNVSTNVGNAVKNVKDNTPQIRIVKRNNGNTNTPQSNETFTSMGSMGSNTELRHNGTGATTAASIASSNGGRPYTAHTTTSTEQQRATYRKQGLNSFYESLRQRHKEEQELEEKSLSTTGGGRSRYSKTASSLMAFYGDLGKGGGSADLPGNPMHHSSNPSIGSSHPYHTQQQQQHNHLHTHHHNRPATAISYGSKSTAISGLSYKSSDDVESISTTSDPNKKGYRSQSYATRSKLTLANSVANNIKSKYTTSRSFSNNSGEVGTDGVTATDENGGNDVTTPSGVSGNSANGSDNGSQDGGNSEGNNGEAETRQGTPTSTENMEQRHELQATIAEGEREDDDDEEEEEKEEGTGQTPHKTSKSTSPTNKKTITSPSTPNSKSQSSTSSSKRNFGDVVDNIVANALKDTSSSIIGGRPVSHASSRLSGVVREEEEDAATVATSATSKSRRKKKAANKKGVQSDFGDIVDGILSSTNE